MIITLPETFTYEDHEIKEINLDLQGRINPKVQNMLEQRYYREILGRDKNLSDHLMGVYHETPSVDKRFRLLVFEYLTGYPREAITSASFPLKEYNEILTAIASFFINWQEPYTEEEPPENGA